MLRLPLLRADLPAAPRCAVQLAEDIATAMEHCHTRRPPLVHRDLSARNVLLGLDGRARVADFGLALAKRRTFLSSDKAGGAGRAGRGRQGRWVGCREAAEAGHGEGGAQTRRDRGRLLCSDMRASCRPSTRCAAPHLQAGALGTAAYMAPEAMHAGPISERCDVFSYGVLLWEVRCGACRAGPGWDGGPGDGQTLEGVQVRCALRREAPWCKPCLSAPPFSCRC